MRVTMPKPNVRAHIEALSLEGHPDHEAASARYPGEACSNPKPPPGR